MINISCINVLSVQLNKTSSGHTLLWWQSRNHYSQPGPMSNILTITSLWHALTRIWTCTETEFRFCWIKLYHGDNHYTKAPKKHWWEREREKQQYRQLQSLLHAVIFLILIKQKPMKSSIQLNKTRPLLFNTLFSVICVHFDL